MPLGVPEILHRLQRNNKKRQHLRKEHRQWRYGSYEKIKVNQRPMNATSHSLVSSLTLVLPYEVTMTLVLPYEVTMTHHSAATILPNTKTNKKHFLLTFALWRVWDSPTVKRKCFTLFLNELKLSQHVRGSQWLKGHNDPKITQGLTQLRSLLRTGRVDDLYSCAPA